MILILCYLGLKEEKNYLSLSQYCERNGKDVVLNFNFHSKNNRVSPLPDLNFE